MIGHDVSSPVESSLRMSCGEGGRVGGQRLSREVGRAEIGHPGKGRGRGRVVVGAHHEYPAARSTSSCADSRVGAESLGDPIPEPEGETRFMPFVRPRKD